MIPCICSLPSWRNLEGKQQKCKSTSSLFSSPLPFSSLLLFSFLLFFSLLFCPAISSPLLSSPLLSFPLLTSSFLCSPFYFPKIMNKFNHWQHTMYNEKNLQFYNLQKSITGEISTWKRTIKHYLRIRAIDTRKNKKSALKDVWKLKTKTTKEMFIRINTRRFKLSVRYSCKNCNMRFTTWATKVKLTNRRWWINNNYSLFFLKKNLVSIAAFMKKLTRILRLWALMEPDGK